MGLTVNSAEFLKALQKMADAKKQDFQTAALEAAQDLHFKIVGDTPIDSGQAASNWILSVNSSDDTVRDDTSYRNLKEASATVKDAIASGAEVKSIHITNSLPYIRHLEYGLYKQREDAPKQGSNVTNNGYRTLNGYSTQAPNGMLRKNVESFTKMFNARAARLKK